MPRASRKMTGMSMPMVVQPVVQINEGDCAIAALAMFLGRPYATVAEAARRVARHAETKGLYTTQIRRVAKALGVQLEKRRHSLEGPYTGLLTTKRKADKREHVVVLFQGVVLDPLDGLLWDYDTWLNKTSYTPTALLTVKP